MMFWISPLLALIALVTVPVSVVRRDARSASGRSRSSSQQWAHHRQAQRPHRGDVHRPLAGEGLRPAGGVGGDLRASTTRRCTRPSFRAQFISGLIQPAMMFIGNLNYVLVAVVGGLRVASGSLSLGDVQAFIQYSRQFSQPLTQVASAWPTWCSPGVASAERVFELLDADGAGAPTRPAGAARAGCAGRVAFEDVSLPLRAGQAADRGPVADRRARPDGGDRRPDRRRQDHAGQPADAVLRGDRRPDHPRRRRHRRRCPREDLRAQHRHGAPGHLAVRRHDRGEHRVRRRREVDPARRSWRRPRPRTWTGSSARCRTATTR